MGCDSNDSNCDGFDAVCNIPAHNNCFWCNGKNCEEGCATNDNCPTTHPICGHGGADHRCGCNADDDCQSGFICDVDDNNGNGDSNECIEDMGCDSTDANCDGFDAVCNIPAHDNCFWCNGKNCEEGCGGDSNCPHERPQCGGNGDHRCGCTIDDDCPEDLPLCDTSGGDNQCVAGCRDNTMCGSCTEICQPPDHANCNFCDTDNLECAHGCCSDANCPDTHPICGHGGGEHLCGCNDDTDCRDGYYCDIDQYRCVPKPGWILLDSIKIYTSACSDCATEGVNITLLGETNGDHIDGVPCTTNTLDHKATIDFSSGSTVFDGKKNGNIDLEEQFMIGGCYLSGLNGKLTDGGTLTWVGTGTWTPTGQICVDWSDEAENVWTCELS